MASATEGAESKSPPAAALAQGVNTLSYDDVVVFTQYTRLVLPLDGFVFWVKTGMLTQSAMLNSLGLNQTDSPLNQNITVDGSDIEFTIQGSLHYSVQHNQAESESEAINNVVFTALEPIQAFQAIAPDILWIGEYAGDDGDYDGPIRFAFSVKGNYYNKADLFHYSGVAILPAFEANVIDSVEKMSLLPLYVSNSLPIWLALSNYDPPYDNGINCHVRMYPSFLVPNNAQPPYVAVHIDSQGTVGHQSAPYFDQTLSQYSLCMDRVRVTLYGFSNEAANSFLAAFEQYSYDYETIGLSNIPAIRDEKRIQAELSLIALKKTIDFEVWYIQGTVRNVARQLIKKNINYYYPQPLTAVGFVPPAP